MLRTKVMWFWLMVVAMGAQAARAQEAMPKPPKEASLILKVFDWFSPKSETVAIQQSSESDVDRKLREQREKDLAERWKNASCDDCSRLRGDTLLSKITELEGVMKAAEEQGSAEIALKAKLKIESLQEPTFLARIESLKAQAKAAQASGDIQILIDELEVLRGQAASIKAPVSKSRFASKNNVDYETRVLKAQREVFEAWASKFGKEDAATIASTLKSWADSASGSREAATARVLPIMARLAGKTDLDSAQDVAETIVDYAGSLEGSEADRAASAVLSLERRLVDSAKAKGEVERLDTAREILENMEGMDVTASKEREIQRELRNGLDFAKLEALASQPNGPMSFEFQAQHQELKHRLQREAISSCNWLFTASQHARCQEAQAAYQEFNAKDIMAQANAYEMLKNPLGRGDGVNGLQPLQGAQNGAQSQQATAPGQQPQQPMQPQFQANPLQPISPAPLTAWNAGMNGFRPAGAPPMQFGPGAMPMNGMRPN